MWPFGKKQAKAADAAAYHHIIVDECLGDPAARTLRSALDARDWATARAILASPADAEQMALFMSLAADTKGIQEWIEGPLRDDAGSILPLLVRGAHAVYWAWDARGTGTSDTVTEAAWKVWFNRLKLAENCLDEVVDRDPGNAEAWHYLVILGRARQLSMEERWSRFNRLIEAAPTHYMGHVQMLNNLMAKWSGSAEQMFEFARDRATRYPGTALPVLIADAHLEHRVRNGGAEYIERKEVGDELVAAAYQSIWHPAFRPTATSRSVWSKFAYALALADRFPEAARCFEVLGDGPVTSAFANGSENENKIREMYVYWRDYVRKHL
jgi:hypothetical protein